MGAPLPRPINLTRPAPRPNYQQFKSVYTNVTERIADYFAADDGDATQLSASEAQMAARYLQRKADQLSFSSFSQDAQLADAYQAYATVFANLTRALKQNDSRIDNSHPVNSSIAGGDGQLYIGSRDFRFGSELRNLAGRVGTVRVLSFKDFMA